MVLNVGEHKKLHFLKNIEKLTPNNRNESPDIKAILVPHAGYKYSGSLMNDIYSMINWKQYKNVIIISTHHISGNYEMSSETLVMPKTFSGENVRYNINKLNLFDESDDKFYEEHSWIVQIPFIPEDKTVSILLLGTYDTGIADRIISLMEGNDTLIIANTDLLHCGNQYNSICPDNVDRVNKEIIGSIMNRNVTENENGMMCGLSAVRVFIDITKKLKLFAKKYLYSNSRDISDNKLSSELSSVGYTGVIFTDKLSLLQIPRMVMNFMSVDDYNTLIDNKKIEDNVRDFENVHGKIKLNKKYGVFVTIEDIDGKLRGCIGTFDLTNDLSYIIAKYTLLSAFKDSRFSPVKYKELNGLIYKINFIHEPKIIYPGVKQDPYESLKNSEFILGEHGITLYFSDGRSATYLASVIPEIGVDELNINTWNKLVKSLKNKSLSNGNITKIKIYRCEEYNENEGDNYNKQTGGEYYDIYEENKNKYIKL